MSTIRIRNTKFQPVISRPKRSPLRAAQHRIQASGRCQVVRRERLSITRLARELNINAYQIFYWRKQIAERPGAINENPRAALLPVIMDAPAAADEHVLSTSGVIVLTVGATLLRHEGCVYPATLARVLTRLLA